MLQPHHPASHDQRPNQQHSDPAQNVVMCRSDLGNQRAQNQPHDQPADVRRVIGAARYGSKYEVVPGKGHHASKQTRHRRLWQREFAQIKRRDQRPCNSKNRSRSSRTGAHRIPQKTGYARPQPGDQVHHSERPMVVNRLGDSPQPHRHHILRAMWMMPMCRKTQVRSRHHWPPMVSGPKFAPQCRSSPMVGSSIDTPANAMARNTATLMPKMACVTAIELDCCRCHGAVSTR